MTEQDRNETASDTAMNLSMPDETAQRIERLKQDIADYTDVKESIETGFEAHERIARQKAKIMKRLDASEEQWQDYRWQLKNRFTTAEEIESIIDLSEDAFAQINRVASEYRFAISPYYLSLVDPDDADCPIRLQAIPTLSEMDPIGALDPMDEAGSSPTPGVTRRYPDRLIIKVTNQCGMYCRFCQRRRLIGEEDHHADHAAIDKAIAYVAREKEIRDVLLTGGDALMLSDEYLDEILGRLRKIEHVEIIRIGTRTPVTLPQRITPELVQRLKKHHPLYLNTHFNSPSEITPQSSKACALIADAGIPIGNQMVLLGGVNNDKFVVRKLNQQLLRIRVKPYYIFHAKQVRGTSRFWVRIEEGLEIMESLRGSTSGMAIPTYIVNGTGGLGKTPMLPNYLLYIGRNKAVFRNWEGETFEIENDFAPHEFRYKKKRPES
jgi:glutamate 2,3-aminomutase